MDSHDYLSERDFYSPALSASRLDNHFDYEFTDPSPNQARTPSYNGSYQNSPYAPHSELEYDPGMLIFDGQGEYEYDALTSSAMDGGHSSPASSNGLPDQESESRSRASSVSSHSHHPSSPPIQGFESLRFDSPHWNTSLLPADKPSSPSQKPPSPPSLVIPDVSPSMNTESLYPRPPLINAPQGDGGVMNGPQLHIVPATPVSGRVPAIIPFINNPAASTSSPTLISPLSSVSTISIFLHSFEPSNLEHGSNLTEYGIRYPDRLRFQ